MNNSHYSQVTGLDWLNAQPFINNEQTLAAERGVSPHIPQSKTIRYPEDYEDSEILNIACMPLKLQYKQQDITPYKKHKQDYLVSHTGKGKGWKCPTCDADKIAKHQQTFYDLVEEYTARGDL